MGYYVQECKTEFYGQVYATYLLSHYADLKLPYSFSMAFQFLTSPLLVGSAFLCFNDQDEVVGAFGYIRGTGEKNYEDTHVAQLQIIHLSEAHRGGVLLGVALQGLMEQVREQAEEIRHFHFWVPSKLGLHRLCSKLGEKKATWETSQGEIEEYHGNAADWKAYADRLSKNEHRNGGMTE
ncbi:hypothetical protein A7K91_07650 [Paenibacillus oryzae]|uniref:N-acetyltransferase domain-containing protein n=1 Tax=Paenibacillus oryzae TaxID=1844972 RepID=A0A1A5YR34_9BACL|nr:hypothetical protein [Paenibacillus oryzae]OBR68082.1 hypothetical protein A7K91_07650 [Paenibacillus oryzae]